MQQNTSNPVKAIQEYNTVSQKSPILLKTDILALTVVCCSCITHYYYHGHQALLGPMQFVVPVELGTVWFSKTPTWFMCCYKYCNITILIYVQSIQHNLDNHLRNYYICHTNRYDDLLSVNSIILFTVCVLFYLLLCNNKKTLNLHFLITAIACSKIMITHNTNIC